MRRRPRQIRVRSGQFEFVKLNAEKFDWRDTYHLILTLSWPGFAGFVFGIYLLINIVFAALYMLEAHAVAEMRPGSFFNAFFFSVETLATVGYGHMYPETFYGHLITYARDHGGHVWAGGDHRLDFCTLFSPHSANAFQESRGHCAVRWSTQ